MNWLPGKLRMYMNDWDDNLLFMPTKIRMEAVHIPGLSEAEAGGGDVSAGGIPFLQPLVAFAQKREPLVAHLDAGPWHFIGKDPDDHRGMIHVFRCK